MKKSKRATGAVYRELNALGNETGQQIQYHPGTPRHYGGDPYWKVTRNADLGNGIRRAPKVRLPAPLE